MIGSFDPGQDFFALFDLPRGYGIDLDALESRYREIQSRVHPDKCTHLPQREQRLAMQWATRVNEAYWTLKDPLERAHYLLNLAGYDVGLESNTAMSPDFLKTQMALRESVAEAQSQADGEALDTLHRALIKEIRSEQARLQSALESGEQDRAAELLRQLLFQEKLRHQIEDALEAIEP